MDESVPDVVIFRHPDRPGVIRIVVEDGEVGIYELDFQQYEYGDEVNVVDNDWERLYTESEIAFNRLNGPD